MLFEIMSQKIRDKLYKNTSGVNYLLRKKNFLEVRHFTESKRFFKHMAAPTMIRPKYGDNLLSIYDQRTKKGTTATCTVPILVTFPYGSSWCRASDLSIVITGGTYINAGYGMQIAVSSYVFNLNPESKEIVRMVDMMTPRSHHQSVRFAGEIYVFGGRETPRSERMRSGKWIILQALPYNNPVAIAVNKKQICLLTIGSRMLMFYNPIKDAYDAI